MIVTFTSCSIPKDIHGTLEKINKDKVLKIGYSNHPPFIQIKNGDSTGIEYKIMLALGEEMGVHLIFIEGTEAVLIEKIKKYEIDIIIADLK